MIQLSDAAQARAEKQQDRQAATFLMQLSQAVSGLNGSIQTSLALQASQQSQQVEMQELVLRLAESQRAAEEAAERLQRQPQVFAMTRPPSPSADEQLDRMLDEKRQGELRASGAGRIVTPASSRASSSDAETKLERMKAQNTQQQQQRGRSRLTFTAAEELRIQEQATQIAQALDGAKAAGGGAGSFTAALGGSAQPGLSAPPLFAASSSSSSGTLLAPLQTGGLLDPIGQTRPQSGWLIPSGQNPRPPSSHTHRPAPGWLLPPAPKGPPTRMGPGWLFPSAQRNDLEQ